MTRSRFATAAALGGFATAWAGSAAARTAFSAESATGSFLTLLTDRLEFTLKQIPALGRHLANLPEHRGRPDRAPAAGHRGGRAGRGIHRAPAAEPGAAAGLRPPGRPFAAARLRARRAARRGGACWRSWSPPASSLPRSAIPRACGGRLGQETLPGAALLAVVQPAVPRLAPAQHAGGPHRAGRRCRGARPAGGAELGDRPAADRRPCRPRARDDGRQPRGHRGGHHPLRAADLRRPALGGLALAQRDDGLAVGHGFGAQDRLPAEARHGAALVGVRADLLWPDGDGGGLCRPGRQQHRRARPQHHQIGAAHAAAVRDPDAPHHAPHRLGAADGGRRGGRLPAPGGAPLCHHPDRRRADGARAGRHDGGGMAAARPRRQARGGERRGDLRLLAVREVPHGFLHRLEPAALGRRRRPRPRTTPRSPPRGCAP